jgi:branched-chain amino acid transport system substrate-binding protein
MLKRAVALVALVLLLVTACSSSKKNSTANSSSSTIGSASFTLDSPPKFALLAETKGESPLAIPDFADAAAMAVDDVNAAGGIGGQKLALDRIATSAVDPQAGRTSLLKAIDGKPVVMFGLVSGGIATANKQVVADSGIPMLYFYGDPALNFGTNEGTNYAGAFSARPSTGLSDGPLWDYMMKKVKPKKVALLCADLPSGAHACDLNADRAKHDNVQIVAREKFSYTATDMTAQVQAISAANPDAVMTDPFPNQFAIFVNQMVQNGRKIPIFTGASAQIVVAQTHAVKGEAATLVTGVETCVPPLDTRPAVQDWVKRYKARFGYDPGAFSAMTYDSVRAAAEAIVAAKSTDGSKVAAALGQITYAGICDDAYHADQYHVLAHAHVAVAYDTNGTPSIVDKARVAPGLG